MMCESFSTGTTQVVGNVKHPCSVCLKGVGVNSIRCIQCVQWVHWLVAACANHSVCNKVYSVSKLRYRQDSDVIPTSFRWLMRSSKSSAAGRCCSTINIGAFGLPEGIVSLKVMSKVVGNNVITHDKHVLDVYLDKNLLGI